MGFARARARARGREARGRRATRPRVLCARGDPAGHAGALQIGAFARHASPRHVVRPPRPTSPLRPDTDVGVAHHTLGTDALRGAFDARRIFFFFSAFRFLFDEKKKRRRRRRAFGRENSPRPLPPVRKKKPPPFLWCTPRSHDRDDPGEGHSRARERVSRRPVRRRAVGRKQAEPLSWRRAIRGRRRAASKDLPAGVAGSARAGRAVREARVGVRDRAHARGGRCREQGVHDRGDSRRGCGRGSLPPRRAVDAHALAARGAAHDPRRRARDATVGASRERTRGEGETRVGGTEAFDRASADSGSRRRARRTAGGASSRSVLPAAPKAAAARGGARLAASAKAGATGSSGSGSDKEADKEGAKGRRMEVRRAFPAAGDAAPRADRRESRSRSPGRRSSGAPPRAAAGWRSSRTPRWWRAAGGARIRTPARCPAAARCAARRHYHTGAVGGSRARPPARTRTPACWGRRRP